MSTHLSLASLAQSPSDGLTVGEVLSDLPLDPVSLFTLLLVLCAAAAVLYFGSRGGGSGGGTA